MKSPIRIAFFHDKHGRKLAYRWGLAQGRWFRIGLDKAELMLSTGQAVQVVYSHRVAG